MRYRSLLFLEFSGTCTELSRSLYMDWFEKEKKQKVRLIISRRLRDFDETLRACFAEDADAEALLHAERRATRRAPEDGFHRVTDNGR